MIFCARATRGFRRMGRVTWLSSCAWNAHDRNVLVRRAQSRIDQAILENELKDWGNMHSGRSISPILEDITSKLEGASAISLDGRS